MVQTVKMFWDQYFVPLHLTLSVLLTKTSKFSSKGWIKVLAKELKANSYIFPWNLSRLAFIKHQGKVISTSMKITNFASSHISLLCTRIHSHNSLLRNDVCQQLNLTEPVLGPRDQHCHIQVLTSDAILGCHALIFLKNSPSPVFRTLILPWCLEITTRLAAFWIFSSTLRFLPVQQTWFPLKC